MSGRRPLILLHGWTMCGAIFDDLAARLGDVAQCHAPDLPGHGAAADRPATLDACAALVAEQVAAARAPPVLLGWSMGAASGRFATTFTSKRRDLRRTVRARR